jgi:hypothetical protein
MKIWLLILSSLPFLAYGQQETITKADSAFEMGYYADAYLFYKEAADQFKSAGNNKDYTEACLSMVQTQLQNGYPFHAKSIAENTIERQASV